MPGDRPLNQPQLSVWRTTPLPTGRIQGTFFVTEPVLHATRDALESFALAGIHERGHEGIAYWAGRELADTTVFLQCIVPQAHHTPDGVFVDEREVGRMSRAAREQRLGILAQVHSHPGVDARHSDGDDTLILMPFEGMLSVVVPSFGIGFRDICSACVHQFQDGRWVLCTPESVRASIVTVAPTRDLR